MPELIVALDFPSLAEAVSIIDAMPPIISWFKIGLELFTAHGPSAIYELQRRNKRIFLDLKLYDIPNTVGRAVSAAGASGINFLTVHCQGGERMCKAAVEAAAEFPDMSIIGVTALTSFAPGEMPGIPVCPEEYALYLASFARQWGLGGLVCSPQEVRNVKKASGDLPCICPGIRAVNEPGDDQRRTLSPGEAIRNGADFLVVGRPITRAPNPGEAALAILNQLVA